MRVSVQIRKWSGAVLAAACLLATPLAADELLLNADFSKETENWSGDFSNDPDQNNPLDPHTTGQITLDLRKRAVRIFQGFNADTDKLVCNVSFTPSADLAYTANARVSDVASDVTVDQFSGNSYNSGTGVVTLYKNPNFGTYQKAFRTPVIILTNPNDGSVLLYPLGNGEGANARVNRVDGSSPPTPSNDATGGSYTVHIKLTRNRPYRFYLAFPPGTGSVTITKISLQPDTD